jgi:hypothetical protein
LAAQGFSLAAQGLGLEAQGFSLPAQGFSLPAQAATLVMFGVAAERLGKAVATPMVNNETAANVARYLIFMGFFPVENLC